MVLSTFEFSKTNLLIKYFPEQRVNRPFIISMKILLRFGSNEIPQLLLTSFLSPFLKRGTIIALHNSTGNWPESKMPMLLVMCGGSLILKKY